MRRLCGEYLLDALLVVGRPAVSLTDYQRRLRLMVQRHRWVASKVESQPSVSLTDNSRQRSHTLLAASSVYWWSVVTVGGPKVRRVKDSGLTESDTTFERSCRS